MVWGWLRIWSGGKARLQEKYGPETKGQKIFGLLLIQKFRSRVKKNKKCSVTDQILYEMEVVLFGQTFDLKFGPGSGVVINYGLVRN